jgi:hypothetical protein
MKDAIRNAKLASGDEICISLCRDNANAVKTQSDAFQSIVKKITVKQYMTKKSTPDFDFMAKFNNDEPMPLRTMIGTVEKETRGMVYMNLHADITQERTLHCLKCGRPITNPVSQYFGMGPECGGHNYVNPFYSKEELQEAVASYREQLRNITWSGWIIKSAILEEEDIEYDT